MALWIDEPDALCTLDSMNVSDEMKEHLASVITDGITVIRNAVDENICDAVIEDYMRWCEENAEYVSRNLDSLGRPKRLVNFHLHSESAMEIGANPVAHAVLGLLFRAKSYVYTSLTFKYGTQQPVHRDTPHFATWPGSHFAGVWTALEDVRDDAGPLFYHKGGHRLRLPAPAIFLEQANSRIPVAPLQERLLVALDLYDGEVIRRSAATNAPTVLRVKKGDTVIWHPDAPHGGSAAKDPSRTRWSIVFHCAPEGIQVFQHESFFTHDGVSPPRDRYGFTERCGRRVALAGDVAFM